MSVIRTLIVADGYPWPTSSGYAIRLVNHIAALAELGPIDLFIYVWQSRASFYQPPEGLLSRFKVVTRAETLKGIRLSSCAYELSPHLRFPDAYPSRVTEKCAPSFWIGCNLPMTSS